jgi:mono/diheme cytochrome c family protein
MKSVVRTFLCAALLGGTATLMTTAAWAADGAAGKILYLAKCKACHGAEGTPSPAIAKAMGIKPMSDPAVQAKSDDALKGVVTKGEGKMKPIAGIAGADLDNVIAAVRGMK